jgi:hypothetical protein
MKVDLTFANVDKCKKGKKFLAKMVGQTQKTFCIQRDKAAVMQ